MLESEGIFAKLHADVGEPFCSATVNDLSVKATPAGLRNTLGYIARSKDLGTKEIEVYVNINVPSEADQALNKYANTCALVFRAVEGQDMTDNIRRAVRAGQSAKMPLRGANYVLERDNWPTGKGYTNKFFVRPR